MLKRPQIQASFPKAILVVAIVCGVLMVKFKHPHANYSVKNHSRKLHSASLGLPRLSNEATATRAATPSVKNEGTNAASVSSQIQEAKKFGPQLEEDFNRVSIPKVSPPIAAIPFVDTKNCSTAFGKILKEKELVWAKLPPQVHPKVVRPEVKEEVKSHPAPVELEKVQTVEAVHPQSFKRIEKMISLDIHRRMHYPVATVSIAEPMVITSSEPTWTETAFEEPSIEITTEEELASEVNSTSPIDEFVAVSFSEPSLGEAYNEDLRIASVHLENGKDPLADLPEEKRMLIIEGTFEKIEFTDLSRSVALLRESGASLAHLRPAPAPKLAWNELPSQADEPVLVNPVAKKEVSTQEAKAEDDSSPQVVAKTTSADQSSNSQPEVSNPSLEQAPTESKGQAPSEPIEEDDEPTIVKMLHKHALDAGPKFGSLGDARLSSQQYVPEKKPEVSSQSYSKFIPPPNTPPDPGGTIHGRLTADQSFLSWLESSKGHVELSLHPVGSSNPDDTIRLYNYWFPDKGEKFEINAKNIEGSYRLIASVYNESSAIPLVQIPYEKLITAAGYKENIYFQLKKEVVNPPPWHDKNSSNEVILNLTLFEGASGNHRQPKTLKQGEVSVVGLPELGTFRADKEGNIRIPKIPASSEIIIEAKGKGYYDTRQIIPTFTTDVYAPVYLIQKEKVETVTKFFTKREQVEGKSILMGRVFDTESRVPLADQEISLSFRKGSALYFDVFPDPRLKATRNSGMYGFFNVEPAFRSISRAGGNHSLLLNIEPNMGYYVETGRGGSRGLKLTLKDPFSNQAVEAKVHLVGDELAENHSDQKGKVTFEGLDLPPGVVTVETEAEGYPRTWHTIPWSTREPEKNRTLYMMEKEMVLESAVTIARVKREKHRGALVGGAHTSLFKRGRENIKVTLYGTDGSQVSNEHGPFPLTNTKFNPKEDLMLTRENPGFTFFNLVPGEYLLKWQDTKGNTFRTHVVRVGADRLAIVVN